MIDQQQTPQTRRLYEGHRMCLAIGIVVFAAAILFYAWNVFRIGYDIREGAWAERHMNGDIRDAMNRSNEVMDYARQAEAEDAAITPIPPGGATLAEPGPGLFSPPFSVGAFFERWHRLSPVYGHIRRGWVRMYDELDQGDNNKQTLLDYPPMRMLALTLWMWRVEEKYPNIMQAGWPEDTVQIPDPRTGRNVLVTPEIVRPMLTINLIAEIISSIVMFLLVWLWVARRERGSFAWNSPWRSRWGDRMLLLPLGILCFYLLLRPFVWWSPGFYTDVPTQPVDVQVMAAEFWFDLIVGYITAVSLAWFLPNPFRGPALGMIAATIVWLNPPMILDSHLWPQWDCWLPTFFLVAALLVSLNCWTWAGIVIGLGCMCKGQILFAAPVLMLSPLLAGWPMRFLRIVAGFGASTAIVVWPWLIDNTAARHYVVGVIIAAVIVAAISLNGLLIIRAVKRLVNAPPMRAESPLTAAPTTFWQRNPRAATASRMGVLALLCVAMTVAALLVLYLWSAQSAGQRLCALLLCGLVVVGPWLIGRRLLLPWITFVFAGAVWMAGICLDGKFSWFRIGFVFGTQRWQQMQLGYVSLSNLSSILEQRWRWHIHDVVGYFPLLGRDVDLRETLALIYFGALILCVIGAAIHLRRGDARFMAALTAPWLLFLTLLTQMAARYTLLPAVIAASLLAVSVSASMLPLLITLFGCVMLGNQYFVLGNNIGPMAQHITGPTFPDLGWGMLFASAVLLYLAAAPTRRRARSIPLEPPAKPPTA